MPHRREGQGAEGGVCVSKFLKRAMSATDQPNPRRGSCPENSRNFNCEMVNFGFAISYTISESILQYTLIYSTHRLSTFIEWTS